MEFRPILSALMRNKTGAILIALQIALTMAIVTNAAYIIEQRSANIASPTGLDEANTIVAVTSDFDPNIDKQQLVRDDLDYIGAIPGVIAVTTSHSTPASGSGNGECYQVAQDTPSDQAVCYGNFSADENGIAAFGLDLVEGRNFRADEIIWSDMNHDGHVNVALVSKALADELFPEGGALGKMVWQDESSPGPTEIIGIYAHMQNAWPRSGNVNRTSLQPYRDVAGPVRRFVVRTESGQRDRVMIEVEEHLTKNRGRLVHRVQAFSDQKKRTYANDIAMVKLLSGVVVILGLITGLGIVGLAWFSVSQRRKQIGTRRALGASKMDIMRYFMVENWLITSMGLVLGIAGTLALNWFLDTEYQTGRIPMFYLPVGVVLLWLLGQLAVFAPARRAAGIAPAMATRSV